VVSVKVDKNQHVVTQPEPGKALVYVIAEENPDDSYNIGDITTRVGLDGTWVGANYGESYLSFTLAPGEHRVCVDGQSTLASRQQLNGAAELTVEVGKTYYFHFAFRTDGRTSRRVVAEASRLGARDVVVVEGWAKHGEGKEIESLREGPERWSVHHDFIPAPHADFTM